MTAEEFGQALVQLGCKVPAGGISPPRTLVFFGDAPGDDLLCTTVLRELKRRCHADVWMATRHPELFARNGDVDQLVAPQEPLMRYLQQIGTRIVVPRYAPHDWQNDQDPIPKAHILAIMCAAAGVTGPVTLRPYLELSPDDKAYGRFGEKQIAVQTSGMGARFAMRNKEWLPERFAEVAAALRPEYTVVQLGAASDPPLVGAVDLRGKTSSRQAAGVIWNSLAFVGLVGFLMHLARAVGRRSVIVYGGREQPWQSGYACNENVTRQPACSPCWRWNTCGHDHECMTGIGSELVTRAVGNCVARFAEPLITETLTIAPPP
ncbi:MAG: glycosyltransferase family 9 protein [Tepidisphaeraceae bacterium]|jgi:hypothetical protein